MNFLTTKITITYIKTFPVWSGMTSPTGGKDHPVSSGIRFPMERNMQPTQHCSDCLPPGMETQWQ